MKIFDVTMLMPTYVEKNRKTRNKLKIKVFIKNRRFCRQTLIELTSLLGRAVLPKQVLPGQTDLLGQTSLGRTGFLGRTSFFGITLLRL